MTQIRRSDLVSALSLASDLALGQPMGHGQRTVILAVDLSKRLQLRRHELRDVYFLASLRSIGCNAVIPDAGAVFGDEIAVNAWLTHVDVGDTPAFLGALARHIGAGQALATRAVSLARVLVRLPQLAEGPAAHCEVGRLLAARMGFSDKIQRCLGQTFERWDGRGRPGGLRGASIALETQIVELARCVELAHRAGGVGAAVDVVRERSGSGFDPELAEAFVDQASACVASLDVPSIWEAARDLEPAPHDVLDDETVDGVLGAMGDFADLRSPSTHGHAAAVAALSAAAAELAGLGPEDVRLVRRAGLVHDMGTCGVPAGLLARAGPLDDGARERVRMHAYYTERILQRPAALARIGDLAAMAHERVDGGGYHRRLRAGAIPLVARILAAADVYQAMREPRPHRAARSADDAAAELRRGADQGRLDPGAALVVLRAAGHRAERARSVERPCGLGEREVDVLKLLARGLTDKEIAQALGLSTKTVRNHVQHIYPKIGVTTRVAAAMFAMQHDLIER